MVLFYHKCKKTILYLRGNNKKSLRETVINSCIITYFNTVSYLNGDDSSRLLNAEVQSREEVRELAVLRRKTQSLEQSNAELLSKMIRAQYKDGIPKSMTYDDIGPHLLSM